jgi:hypothetical protein
MIDVLLSFVCSSFLALMFGNKDSGGKVIGRKNSQEN